MIDENGQWQSGPYYDLQHLDYSFELKWKVRPGATVPSKGHPDDAGWDVAVQTGFKIGPGEFLDVATGVFVQPPVGVWGMLAPRSSTLRTWGLRGVVGIIDSGYRGELFVAIEHAGRTALPIEVPAGTRLFQYIPMNNVGLRMGSMVVSELDDTSRGEGGFGSTGR